MIARVLIYIKHQFPRVWVFVEYLNSRLFKLLHGKKLQEQADFCFEKFGLTEYEFRFLRDSDLETLESMLSRQGEERLRYFQPHNFDLLTLKQMWLNPAFLMFGVFLKGEQVGYFFLRCFWNQKCFVGRLIDEPHEGKGIGRVMNKVMYNTAWRSGFRCMTTVSRDNASIMRSHRNNPYAKVVQELPGDYLMLEFLPHANAGLGKE